mgnify:CR=1
FGKKYQYLFLSKKDLIFFAMTIVGNNSDLIKKQIHYKHNSNDNYGPNE